ncbi:MAG: hypothetical protein Q9160_005480 [Pyrenula sp. 1 TL-2023]
MADTCCAITKLPTEVIQCIAHNADPSVLLSLRLTCRTLSSQIARCFARVWFASTRADLTPKSLQKLQDISQSNHLREHVEELVIPCTLKNIPSQDLARVLSWPRSPNGRLDDPGNLLCVKKLQKLLLAGLTNCRSFRIEGFAALHYYDPDCLWPNDVVNIILTIIAETGIHIRSFDLDFQGYGPKTQRFDVRTCQQPGFREAWAHVKHLRLAFGVTRTSNSLQFVTDLLTHARHLQVLSLRPDRDYAGKLLSRYLSSREVPLHLRELYLHNACVDADCISRLLVASRESLRKVLFSFVYVRVEDDSWARILNHLRNQFPHLDSFELDFCKQLGDGRDVLLTYKGPSDQVPTIVWSNECRPPDTDDLPPLTMSEENPRCSSTQNRLNLTCNWFDNLDHATGVKYEGPKMAEALGVIIKSIEYIEFTVEDDD